MSPNNKISVDSILHCLLIESNNLIAKRIVTDFNRSADIWRPFILLTPARCIAEYMFW